MTGANTSRVARQRYYDIFVSSTSVDLVRHRQQVREALVTLRQHPLMMEDFGAQVGDGTSVSTKELAEADLVLLVVAWRYGYVPAGADRSITEQEYDEALRLGKDCLVFLADPTTEARDDLFPLVARDPEHAAQLRAFRLRLERGHVRATFSTPEDLAKQVTTAVSGWLQDHPGVLVPRDVPPTVARDFVGREAEVARLLATLRGGQSTAISAAVAGMAGVGKSALAAEVVRRLVADESAFPGGIASVFCGEQAGPDGLAWVYDRLLDAWGTTIDPAALARAQEPAAAVAVRERALRERLRPSGGAPPAAALVLLDNVEEGLPLAQVLATLGALGVTVLTTSRHRPDVPGLELLRLDVLEPGPALILFGDRYREAGGDWREARDSGPAGQSVALLGYLPLAIELAAAYAALAGLGVAELAAELAEHERLALLTPTLGDPARGVRFAFTKTSAHLDAPSQLAFAALGLPAGADWPREVIEGLLAGVLADVPDAPDPHRARWRRSRRARW